MPEIGVSLGSNLGRRLANLAEARRRIAALPDVRVVAWSPVYETEPVDVPPEFRRRRFLNAVLILSSRAAAPELAARLHAIEKDMGRRRTGRRSDPRAIDLDIIYAGRQRIRTPRLAVPHPRWASRRFVAQPLADVRPGLVLPGERRTIRDVLASLPAAPRAVFFQAEW